MKAKRRIRDLKRCVVHYGIGEVWGGVDLCGHEARSVKRYSAYFYSGDGNPKHVTCLRCRRRLTYWVLRAIRARKRNGLTGEIRLSEVRG